MDSDVNSMYPYTSRYIKQNEEHLMRVLNKKYWPHHVSVKEPRDAAERWCYENIKSSEWRNVGPYFAFKRSGDATMFALRWL